MGEVSPSFPDISTMATKADLAAMDAKIPMAASSAPPAVADASAKGTQSTAYALENHTHASKSRKARLTTAATGLVTWTFDPPFAAGVSPIVVGMAETASNVTDVVNVQVEGTPTNTSCVLRVSRTNRSVVALIGLTVLSVPSQPGATVIHALALEP